MLGKKDNIRIAKNTAMLYFRMLLTMAVSLYTSRIVLNTLGIEDFGIYSVVGGFVTMFGFLNSSMASASQRFLAFEIGRNDKIQLGNVFSMTVNIHLLISIVVLFIAETLGLWFVKTQLMIPHERMVAAHWVYQFSILTLIVNMVSVPYNAMIIAHERMNVFAWVSIIEVSLKLFIVFLLQWFGFDKLKLYAVLLFIVALFIRLIYGIYCNRNFFESKYRYYWNKPLFKTLVSYAGWNLWGNAAGVIMEQGVNILLNVFFGPVINAARGIAFQLKGAINLFVVNFQMAMNPQIIKSFATNDLKYMHLLISQGAKYSFFLLFALSLPIMLEAEIILKLWLKTVPEYTVIFIRLLIINILVDSISGPLMTAAQASGKIKLYQSVVGGILIMNLPISYLFLRLGNPPEITVYVSIAVSIIAFFSRLIIISPLVNLNIYNYLNEVVFKIIPVILVAIVIPYLIKINLQEGFIRLIISGVTSIFFVGISIFYLGLRKEEQLFLNIKIQQLLAKFRN